MVDDCEMFVTEPIDTLFRVLAEPTRRRILDVLAERGEQTVTQLSDQFPHLVTSGISKHLMELRGLGVVRATRQGRHQLYRLEADAVTTVLAPWLEKYERYWTDALRRLRALAEGVEHNTSYSRLPAVRAAVPRQNARRQSISRRGQRKQRARRRAASPG
jgi:DNA-binding transcriptional ArsR family regulator